MSEKTGIEWTESTWSPVTGCSIVSSGCARCYAQTLAATRLKNHPRYKGLAVMKSNGPHWTGEVRFHPDQLDIPLRWRRPRKIFVCNQSDLFHEKVTDQQIASVFNVMAQARQHTFQVLTKRPERMLDWFTKLPKGADVDRTAVTLVSGVAHFTWPLPNVWLGTSVENQPTADERIVYLLQTPAAVRYVSYEPALGAVDFRHLQPGDPPTEIDCLSGTHGVLRPHRGSGPKIDWLIVGGESGPGARPCDVEWIRSAVRQCREAGVACFVKQLGARATYNSTCKDDNPKARCGCGPVAVCMNLKDRKGGDQAEWPEDLRVREFPR